jgi:dihydroorotase
VRGRFAMKNRQLEKATRGWGRSVHAIQDMPVPRPRNLDQTIAAALKGPRE